MDTNKLISYAKAIVENPYDDNILKRILDELLKDWTANSGIVVFTGETDKKLKPIWRSRNYEIPKHT